MCYDPVTPKYQKHYFWDDPHLYKEGVDGLDVVYLSMNRNRSYASVTPRLMEGTTLETEPHIRYYSLVFIGLLSSRMHVCSSFVVINAKEYSQVLAVEFSIQPHLDNLISAAKYLVAK